MTDRTGLVWHELYMWHNTGNYAGIMPAGLTVQPYEHVENPDTKRRFKNLLDVSALTRKLVDIEPRVATRQELLRVHTEAYVAQLESLNATGGTPGVFTPMGPGGFDIACLSAGGVLALLDAIMDGAVNNGYALNRPPGHHAVADAAVGFCFLCNGAIGGRHLLETRGLERIAFVDWDVHHGNGTEAAFWEDPRALTISVHQDRCFPPDSGAMQDIGAGAGEGYNLNIPLPPGSGWGAYEAVFDRIVVPALHAFAPQMIIVPSGFDAGAYDPLGRQMMHSDGYRALTAKLKSVAARHCEGRLAFIHEGGYSAPTVPYFGLAVLEELSGIKTKIDDPFQPILAGLGGQELQPHQDAVISEVATLLDGLRPAW